MLEHGPGQLGQAGIAALSGANRGGVPRVAHRDARTANLAHRVAQLAVVLGMAGCAEPVSEAAPVPESRIPEGRIATAEDPIEPIPRTLDLDPRRVELGRLLFVDPRLSGDGSRNCVSCHVLDQGGIVPDEVVNNHPLDNGGPYNVPTVFNVAFDFRLNWQGRFETLEDHIGGPMMNPLVMDAGTWDALLGRLRPAYDARFRAAGYPDGVTEAAVRHALATYERSLITPDARFDLYLRGEGTLTEAEQRGYDLFKGVGCISCHQGINVGGNLYQRFGVVADAFEGRHAPEPADRGLYQITGNEADMRVFRVPSLRNVAVTAPYFHDGSAATLEDAIQHMARVQLGYLLSDDEVSSIAAFLRTLTGRYRGQPIGPEGT